MAMKAPLLVLLALAGALAGALVAEPSREQLFGKVPQDHPSVPRVPKVLGNYDWCPSTPDGNLLGGDSSCGPVLPDQTVCPNPNFPYPSTCASSQGYSICYNSAQYALCGTNPGPSSWCCNSWCDGASGSVTGCKHPDTSCPPVYQSANQACPGNTQYICTSSSYRSSTITLVNNLPQGVDLTTAYWWGKYNSYIWLDCLPSHNVNYQGATSQATQVCPQTIKSGQSGTFTVYSDSSADATHIYQGALTFKPSEAYTRQTGLKWVILNYGTSDTNTGPYPYTFNFVKGDYTETQVAKYSGCASMNQCIYGNEPVATYYCPNLNECSGNSNDGIASPILTCGTNPGITQDLPSATVSTNNACPTTPTSTVGWQMTEGFPKVTNNGGGSSWEQYTVSVSEGLSFSGFTGSWVWISQNANQYEIARSTTWESSGSSTIGSSFTTSMEESMSEETDATFLGMGEKITMGFKATESFTTSTSSTIEESTSTTTTQTLQVNCPNGNIWQWTAFAEPNQAQTQVKGRQTVTSLSFACVPDSLGPYTMVGPNCPEGYCSDHTCQCCSGSWSQGDEDKPYLTPQAGGNCTEPA